MKTDPKILLRKAGVRMPNILILGGFLKTKIKLLRKYCIPAPVIEAACAVALADLLREANGYA